jgi:hypothetical protein
MSSFSNRPSAQLVLAFMSDSPASVPVRHTRSSTRAAAGAAAAGAPGNQNIHIPLLLSLSLSLSHTHTHTHTHKFTHIHSYSLKHIELHLVWSLRLFRSSPDLGWILRPTSSSNSCPHRWVWCVVCVVAVRYFSFFEETMQTHTHTHTHTHSSHERLNWHINCETFWKYGFVDSANSINNTSHDPTTSTDAVEGVQEFTHSLTHFPKHHITLGFSKTISSHEPFWFLWHVWL